MTYMMQLLHRKRILSRGFTLVEILVAMAILGVGLLGVASMVGRSTTQDYRAFRTALASMALEDYIESLGAKQNTQSGFNSITNHSWIGTFDGNRSSGEPITPYTVNCTVRDDSSTPPLSDSIFVSGCKEMTCTLTWNTAGTSGRTSYVYVFTPNYK